MDDEDGALTKAYLWYNLFPNKRSCYFPTFYRVPVWFFCPCFQIRVVVVELGFMHIVMVWFSCFTYDIIDGKF